MQTSSTDWGSKGRGIFLADIADNRKAKDVGDAFTALVNARKFNKPDYKIMGGTLERTSISEQVSTRIFSMIKSGNLKAGDKLPTEKQMCVALGISRPPLREALKALTLMGILESRQGGRYTVTDLSPTRLVTPFNVFLSVPDEDLRKQFEARAVVELELVRFCVERANDEQCARIVSLGADGHNFYHYPVGFRLLDAEYHQAINMGANNQILSLISDGLYNVALDARRLASATPGVNEISTAQHCRVAEAIADRDTKTAVSAYREHLDHVLETTLHAIHKLPEQKDE
jgi:GntR family transcriptional repressor for pyruvate dehydrogenase complex